MLITITGCATGRESTNVSTPIGKVRTGYDCGPTALATLGYLLGLDLDEQELAILAGTDERGITSMYGSGAGSRGQGIKSYGDEVNF